MPKVTIWDKEIYSASELTNAEAEYIYKYTANMEIAISLNKQLRSSSSNEGEVVKKAIIKKGETINNRKMVYRKVQSHHDEFMQVNGIVGPYPQSTIISTSNNINVLVNWGGSISYHIILAPGVKYIKVTHAGGKLTQSFDEYLLAGGFFFYKSSPIGDKKYAILYTQTEDPSHGDITALENYTGNDYGMGRVQDNNELHRELVYLQEERRMEQIKQGGGNPFAIITGSPYIFDIRWSKYMDETISTREKWKSKYESIEEIIDYTERHFDLKTFKVELKMKRMEKKRGGILF